MDDKENNQISENNKILIAILMVITATALCVTIWALFFRNPNSAESDYAPQHVESNAESMDSEDSTQLEAQEGGGAVSLTYSNMVELSLSTREAEIIFQNPSKSNQDMVLQLLIDGKVIAKSERIPIGFKLQKLSNVDTEKLSAGTYEGKYVVSYFDAKSGEKAVVNTEIPVMITVKQ